MTWPEIVWNAPVLRSLDARGRAEIEAAGTLRTLGEGEVLFRLGEPADAFFVVTEGRIGVRAVRRGEVDASVIREIGQGESFGEEATLAAGGTRHMEAAGLAQSRVAEVKITVFRRAIERSLASPELARQKERTLRRAATSDLLRTMTFTRELADRDLEVLLDAAEHVTLARGEALFSEGDTPSHVYFVADGMLQVQTEDDARIRVRAYLTRGDVVGDAEIVTAARRPVSAVASGAAWVIGVPRTPFLAISRKNPGLLERIRRIAEEHAEVQQNAVLNLKTTRHVFKDLYRMQVARSMLVIDESSCVRCGHCAWSCANAHPDGVSRLIRRGDKIVSRVGGDAATLFIPNSCQHCDNPACMLDCPTGAIGRDPRGEVFIRENLCTGCGNCAKGCPWDNIQLAPRKGGGDVAQRSPGHSPEVAVKCDLCRDLGGSPACVAACPTEAIARVNPADAFPEVGLALGKDTSSPLPRSRAAWPYILGALPVALALSVLRASTRNGYVTTGLVAATLVLLLAAYSIVKRAFRLRLRGWFIGHLALGVLSLGAVLAHAGARLPPNLGGALQLAFWGAALTGVCGATMFRLLPSRLAKIERRGSLPEDLASTRATIDDRTFAELSGKNELVKAIYARFLRPYARHPLGPIALVLSNRSLGEEERRVRRVLSAMLQGRSLDKLRGIDPLVRLAVERRAIVAQRVLQACLRGWAPIHVVLAAIALVFLIAHAILATSYR